MCLLHMETRAGKERAPILTNGQSEGLCIGQHMFLNSMIALGECFFSFDEKQRCHSMYVASLILLSWFSAHFITIATLYGET